MPRDLIQKYINNPWILAAAAAVAAFVILLIILLIVKRSRRKSLEEEWAVELDGQEHETAHEQSEPAQIEPAMRRTAPLDPGSQKLLKFAASVIENSTGPDSLGKLSEAIIELIGADSASLWRVDAAVGMVKVVNFHGPALTEMLPIPLGQGITGRIAEAGEPVVVEDAPNDPRCLFPHEARENGIISYVGAPVTDGGRVIGVIEAYSSRLGLWSRRDAVMLKQAAELLTSLFRNINESASRIRVETAYLSLVDAMVRLTSLDELMEAAVQVLGHALGASRVVEVEFEGDKMLPIRYEFRDQAASSAKGSVYSPEFATRVLSRAKGGPIVMNDSRSDSLLESEIVAHLGIQSEMAVMIQDGGSSSIMLYIHQCDRKREWETDEIEFASRVATHLALSIKVIQSRDQTMRELESARSEVRRAAEAGTRIRVYVDALPEAVVGLDKDGRITFFNGAARERLGLRNEDIGRQAEMTESMVMSKEGIWNRVRACERVTRFDAEIGLMSGPVGPAGEAETTAGAMIFVPVSISVGTLRNEKNEIAGRVIVVSDVSHLNTPAPMISSRRVPELERLVRKLEESLKEARATEVEAKENEATARAALDRALQDDAELKTASADVRRMETELRKERDQLREDEARARRSAQQLLEINRLKSEFIVNAGRELEGSLQSVAGFAELLGQGSYGDLNPDQLQVVQGIYAWARRMKADVDWLIEYGSSRGRRLDTNVPEGAEEAAEAEAETA